MTESGLYHYDLSLNVEQANVTLSDLIRHTVMGEYPNSYVLYGVSEENLTAHNPLRGALVCGSHHDGWGTYGHRTVALSRPHESGVTLITAQDGQLHVVQSMTTPPLARHRDAFVYMTPPQQFFIPISQAADAINSLLEQLRAESIGENPTVKFVETDELLVPSRVKGLEW